MEDTELIRLLGGAAKVAELLGYDKEAGGVQRVHNWIARGIPYRVKVEHPELILIAQRAAQVEGQGKAGVVLTERAA